MLERAKTDAQDGLSPETLRRAFGQFATGVTVVTTASDVGPLGFTANSFSSVSLDPPLVQWSLARRSKRHDAFASAPRYAIHILRADQAALALAFASEGDAFEDGAWRQDADGVPVLSACAARLDCRSYATYPAGDHTLILGQVVGLSVPGGPGLVFSEGRYGRVDYSSPD